MTLPALRQLHLYPRNGNFSPGFLDRHPALTHLTLYSEARPPRNVREVPAAECGQLPNLVNLRVSHVRTLKQVFQRTPPATLRRLDMTIGDDLKPADLNGLVDSVSALQHLNLWVSSFSPTPWSDLACLEPLPTVTRFGILAPHFMSFHVPFPCEDGAAERLARIFPAMERLELEWYWRTNWHAREKERAREELCA